MTNFIRPILVGGGLGLGLGVAATAAAVLAPVLAPKAPRALTAYLEAVSRARQRAGSSPRLQELHDGNGRHE